MATKIFIIAAVSEKDLALGRDNDLLWDIPEDLRQFKAKTQGHVVIMGRKTFESMGRPLRDRKNIIITRNEDYQANGVYLANSVESAIRIAKKLERDEEIYVIGGGEIYKQMMEYADAILLTVVHRTYVRPDTFFPKISSRKWREANRSEQMKSKNGVRYTFVEYERIAD